MDDDFTVIHHAAQRRRLDVASAKLAMVLALAAVLDGGQARAEQRPPSRLCAVAAADKAHLSVNCPNGRLVDLLAGIRDRTGVAFFVPPNLLTTPISVVLDHASLQSVLDAALAEYDYALDGPTTLVGGRAAGTSVTIFSMREASSDVPHAPSADSTAPAAEHDPPEPSAQSVEATPSEPSATEERNPGGDGAQTAESPGAMPEVSSEEEVRVREAFFANLPTPGTSLPMAPSPAELPPAPVVTNETGPGDGRSSLPLPDFTPGAETGAPPGVPR